MNNQDMSCPENFTNNAWHDWASHVKKQRTYYSLEVCHSPWKCFLWTQKGKVSLPSIMAFRGFFSVKLQGCQTKSRISCWLSSWSLRKIYPGMPSVKLISEAWALDLDFWRQWRPHPEKKITWTGRLFCGILNHPKNHGSNTEVPNAVIYMSCCSKCKVWIKPVPQTIQTSDPDPRSRPFQGSWSRPLIQTFELV